MSNVSNRHTVQLFVSGESKPLSGQRLAKVGYKTTQKMIDEGKTAPESICVSVPHITEDQVISGINRLAPYLVEYLQGVQDNIIRSLYEGKNYSLSSVSDEEIDINSICAYLESESTGGRLTKEYLVEWFNTNVSDNLSVVIAEKLGFDLSTDEQLEKVSQHVNAYRDLIASLSGGKTSLEKEQIAGVKRALEVSAVDDTTSARLINRLNDMEKKLSKTPTLIL